MPIGLRTIAELQAETRADAEADARMLTMTWVSLVCFVAGVEIGGMPQHIATLEQVDDEPQFALTQFLYDLHDVLPTFLATLDLVQPIDERLRKISTDEDLSRRLALAVRWYTVGLGEIDSVNRFLSFWVALEALGPPLSDRFHGAAGVRAPCAICQNPAGKGRYKHLAGMQHVMALVSGDAELLARLRQARDDIFHGLRDLDELEEAIGQGQVHLPKAVARAILTAVAPPASGHDYQANEPVPLMQYPHARLDCTLVHPSHEHLAQVMYRHLFLAELRDLSVEEEQDGTLSITSGVALSCPDDLRVVGESFTLLPIPGLIVKSTGKLRMFPGPGP